MAGLKAEYAAEDETRGEERKSGMSNSGQLSVVSGKPLVIRARGSAYYGICCVKDCGSLATVDTETGIYCADCWNWIEAMRKAAPDERSWIARWVWVPEAAFVACAFGFLLFKVFVAFYEWIAAGGVQ